MSEENSFTQARLIEKIHAARQSLWSFIANLRDDDLVTWCDDVGWSVKDHLVHLALWQNGITATLRRQSRGAAMGITGAEYDSSANMDDLNALMRSRYAHLTPGEVKAMLQRAEEDFDAAIARYSIEDLQQGYGTFEVDNPDDTTPMIAYIIGNTYEHYAEHLPWIQAIISHQHQCHPTP